MPLVIITMMVFIINPMYGFPECIFEPDAPDCSCFDNFDNTGGSWNPGGAFIQNVASQTVGTRESELCSINDGGKPYYQMVLGCNNEDQAIVTSTIISIFESILLGSSPFHKREAWCSETISYWHREADIPYSGGYRTWWHLNWQNNNVSSLKQWYIIEEAIGSRGRWINWDDVDYEDFELGVTVPVPGAYVAIRDCTMRGNIACWLGNSHSLMINEMWVHTDAVGKVFKVEVSLLEGNSSNRVKDTRHWDDILSITPLGSEWIGEDRKIYGFGIDLDAAKRPVYDNSRLHWVSHRIIADVTVLPIQAEDHDWDRYGQQIPLIEKYARAIKGSGGPTVASSSKKIKIDGIPDGRNIHWYFPSKLSDKVEILIDLLDVHPLPIRGVELRWRSGFLPQNYKVQFAGANQSYKDAMIPDLSNVIPLQESSCMSIPAVFARSETGVEVRYIKLIFPKASFQKEATVEELRFVYDQGPWEDAEDNPIPLGSCSIPPLEYPEKSKVSKFEIREFFCKK
jgi:hypothetical protein